MLVHVQKFVGAEEDAHEPNPGGTSAFVCGSAGKRLPAIGGKKVESEPGFGGGGRAAVEQTVCEAEASGSRLFGYRNAAGEGSRALLDERIIHHEQGLDGRVIGD